VQNGEKIFFLNIERKNNLKNENVGKTNILKNNEKNNFLKNNG